MIAKEKIAALVHEKLGPEMFLVDLTVSPTNIIHVEIDSFLGVTIDNCVAISRHIESNLDREQEDFELQVSSAGLDQPFKVKQQFIKNTGREIELVTTQNAALKGRLVEATDSSIVFETVSKGKKEGERRKQEVVRTLTFTYEEIKKAKVIISFK
ncbi:MAG TPA: ribosome assembly cofactor RimP [Prolixibacteraceae bacterium]|nr:ribosome assembly cofactor RimP [Prolixibacteraceae bacterium]